MYPVQVAIAIITLIPDGNLFNPRYLDTLNLIIKVYVSLFLIIRFNPFIKLKINNFDRKIIFSSGIFLLSTTAITEFIKSFILTKIKIPKEF